MCTLDQGHLGHSHGCKDREIGNFWLTWHCIQAFIIFWISSSNPSQHIKILANLFTRQIPRQPSSTFLKEKHGPWNHLEEGTVTYHVLLKDGRVVRKHIEHVISQTKDSAAEINSSQDDVDKSDLLLDMPPPGTSRLNWQTWWTINSETFTTMVHYWVTSFRMNQTSFDMLPWWDYLRIRGKEM